MKQNVFRHGMVTALTLLFSVPTAYFMIVSILKFGLNIDGPYDSSETVLLQLGIDKGFGWNINLLIVFGPPIGFVVAISQVLKIDWNVKGEHVNFHFQIRKDMKLITLAFFSLAITAGIALYLFAENFRS